MLVQMEGCDPSSAERRVLLVGATNRPEVTATAEGLCTLVHNIPLMLVACGLWVLLITVHICWHAVSVAMFLLIPPVVPYVC